MVKTSPPKVAGRADLEAASQTMLVKELARALGAEGIRVFLVAGTFRLLARVA
jgi:hypothetical protein